MPQSIAENNIVITQALVVAIMWLIQSQTAYQRGQRKKSALLKLPSSRGDFVHPQAASFEEQHQKIYWRKKTTSLKQFSKVTK